VPSLRALYRSPASGLDRRVTVLSLTSLVMMLGSSIISPVLPLYARDFGVGYASAGLLVSAFALGRLLFDYAGGALADRLSTRLLAAAGAIISALSAFLSARATSFTALVLYRSLEGLGSAFYVVTIMALFARTVPAERMGKAMSFYQSMVLLGVSFGPTIGGIAAEQTGSLRAPFFLMAGLDLAVAVVTLAVLRPDGEPSAHVTPPRPALREVFAHLSGRAFAYVLLLTFFVFAIRAGTRSNLIPLFGREHGGLGASAIGFILSASAFANFAVLWHAGSLLDRLGRQRVALPTLVATAAISAVFAMSPGFSNLLVASTLLGVALGYLAPAPAAMVADLTPRALMGPVIGIYRTAGDLGLLLGPVALGATATAFGFEAAFFAAAVVSLAIFAVGAAVPETLQRGRSFSVTNGDEPQNEERPRKQTNGDNRQERPRDPRD